MNVPFFANAVIELFSINYLHTNPAVVDISAPRLNLEKPLLTPCF
jgi:hypothetical protein